MHSNIPGEQNVSQNVAINIPYDHDSQKFARNIPYDHDSQNVARNIPYDNVSQNNTRNIPYDQSKYRYTGGLDQTRNTYAARVAARNHIPPEATTYHWVRSTVSEVDMISALETYTQQVRDMVSLVSQLLSEVRPLNSNLTPTATSANNDSPIPPKTDALDHTPAVVPVPLPVPPVVPTGEPVHYGYNNFLKRTVKLECYAGQGALLETFLAKYKEHSWYYEWNDDDRVLHLKNPSSALPPLFFGLEVRTLRQLNL